MAWVQNRKNFERLIDSAEYMNAVYGSPLAYLKVCFFRALLFDSRFTKNLEKILI